MATGMALSPLESAHAADRGAVGGFDEWWAEQSRSHRFHVTQIPFAELESWSFAPDTGNLRHSSGKFFTIEGLSVVSTYGPVPQWTQPIISQPEIGILGIIVKRIDGVLHCLMQSKMEPGNVNTLQLSPTVQATRSNYTRVHRGDSTRYLDYFVQPRRGRVLVDVLQSEQGSWFDRKHNRNMVVEAVDDVPLADDYCWLTIRQVLDLVGVDNLLNMDARSVLSCLPFTAPSVGGSPFHQALHRSLDPHAPALHSLPQVLSWLTEAKARHDVRVRRIPANEVVGWKRTDTEIAHEDGKHFRIIAVNVEASNREVTAWRQPLLAPVAHGIAAFLTTSIDGVLHALLHTRVEPGFIDVVELGPTVQCIPENYHGLPPDKQPRYLDYVLAAPPERIRFSAHLSEEGGRFWDAQSKYMIVDVDDDFDVVVPAGYRWVTLAQLGRLLEHGHYLSVQARSLVTCLYSLVREQ